MHRTLVLQKTSRMVSTQHGQRRVLKRILPLMEYIEKAVETGVYRTPTEIHEALRAVRKGDPTKREPQVAVDRFRKDIIRGTQVHEYPAEYHILKMYPPIPPPPRIPKKAQRRMELKRKKHPHEKLVTHFMQRQPKPKATEEDYYRNLLGIQPPAENYAMGQKSAAISKAYAYAVKQYEVMKTQDVSESEALDIVDKLLAEQNQKEAHASRGHTEEVFEWREKGAPGADAASAKDEDMDATVKAGLPSILHDRPRVVEGMLQWSRLLQDSGIPYGEWTVGASTALDHWIARNILDLSEATWDALLEGTDPSLLSRGQDIVAVRETLFPETRLEVDDSSDEFLQQQEDAERERDERAAMSFGNDQSPPPVEQAREKSVDELLRSLRGLDDKEDDPLNFGGDEPSPAATEEEHQSPSAPKDAIQLLADELQEWRAKNVQSVYAQWPDNEKKRFSAWMEKYLSMLTSEVDRPLIDLEETRIALLSSPPQSEEESDSFWSKLQDETKADIFLKNLLKEGPPEGLSETEKVFWSMPYEDQLEKLINLGTLRPLMDDYISDSERLDFMRRYGDFLLDGVELDHLVPDPRGAITGYDLGGEAIQAWRIQHEDRFSLVKLPYKGGLTGDDEEDDVEEGETGRDLARERARALYQAWNKQKAGRARYEEQMFKQGDLGLSYNTRTENEMEKARQETGKDGDYTEEERKSPPRKK